MTRPQPRTEAEPGTRERLAMELQALPGRSSLELEEAWQRLIRLPQPSKLSRDLLVRIIADKLQQPPSVASRPPPSADWRHWPAAIPWTGRQRLAAPCSVSNQGPS